MANRRVILQGIAFTLMLLCAGNLRTTAQTTPDPGVAGPMAVTKADYNLGDLSYTPPTAAAFPANMEEIGSVHYPTDLSKGPFPVVVFLHGMHEVCYEVADHSNTMTTWPCPTGFAAIPSYAGYDYLGRTLASQGYIVISVSSNAINAINNSLPDYGMNARGVLIQHHLDLWKTWNTTGGAPFGTTFVGKLNMQRVGTMGHSRGGEGVVYNAEYNKSLGSPYGIKAVLPLAPVDFFRHVLNDIPLLNIAPYCDGDVSDLQGVHFYDDARYNVVTDEAPKYNILMLGANHNFFNTVWTPNIYVGGGADDWEDYGYTPTDAQCGTKKATRLDTTKQKAALNAYLPGFFRLYLGNETQFAPIFEVKDIVPPASSKLDTNKVFVSYHPGKSDRLDINRTDNTTSLTTNTLTGSVTTGGLVSSGMCGGGFSMTDCSLSFSPTQEPHSGDASTLGLGQTNMAWNSATDFYQNDIPTAKQDISGYQDLQFRVAVNYALSSPGPNLDFTVQIIDSAGNIGSQQVINHSRATYYEPGTESFTLPKSVFNTVSIPLANFTGPNLKKIRKIKFLYDKSVSGAILVSDLALTNPICGNFQASFKDSIGKLYNVVFTDKSTVAAGDTLSYLWNFGDPTSGTKDTSTAANPIHKYTGKGTYTACAYVKIKRATGMKVVCADTFCTTITLIGVGVDELSNEQISIIPNPAKDYLQITGADKTDVLRLINLYGQVVFTATLSEPVVHLPHTLATGVYYAVVATARGNVYKKIVITQ